MPEAWSSKFDRERSKEVRRIEREHEGTTQRKAEEEAEEEFVDVTNEPRGRRVKD